MQKIILLLVGILSGCGSIWSFTTQEEIAAEQEQRISKFVGLATIKNIYLGDFGKTHELYLVREDIINAIKVRTKRYKVIDNLNEADAEMSVINADTSYPVVSIRRVSDNKTIWTFDCQTQTILWGNFQKLGCQSSQIIDKLFEDTQKADDIIKSQPDFKSR